jgi:hypothetical protein
MPDTKTILRYAWTASSEVRVLQGYTSARNRLQVENFQLHIFALSLRLRSLFGQFKTLENNGCEYLWKEYDREVSPWS